MRRSRRPDLTRHLPILGVTIVLAWAMGCDGDTGGPREVDAESPGCIEVVDPTQGLTMEQALCVASQAGLPEGIEGYSASKQQLAREDLVVWLVMATTYWEPKPCRKGGDALVIDSLTGDVLQHNQWEQGCDAPGAGPDWPGW